MTERLYYTDAYLRDFDATVIDRADGGRRVYLDRTAFYPTSGGQPFDTGGLGGTRVVDVVDEGERVAHLLDHPLPPGPVAGTIDWPRRFDHMQQHTGQHLLSAVIADLFSHPTTSVHFGAESSTLDLDGPALGREQVVAAEERANLLVVENRPVMVGFEQAADAAGLRQPSDRAGTLRIVTILDLDRSACGGTHVRATGEIGPILIRKTERVRKGVRLEFVCGMRAVRRARADGDLLLRLAAPYSAAPEDLPALLEAQQSELKEAAAARRALDQALDGRRARELYQSAVPGEAGIRHIVLRAEPGTAMERLRGLAQAVAGLPRAVFVATTAEPAAVLLASSEDSGVDAGRMLRAAVERVGGRGGGNARLAQGTAPAEALDRLIEGLLAPPA
ncbi:MAG TPA: alanyl-tRNA editing protein [Gemmatimonadales bacterium]|nr:alanyl-tRNA editing protein [Gemmatimonadales bacterium]